VFRIEMARDPQRYCDGISRRSFVQLGVAGMASVALSDVLRAKELSAAAGLGRKDTSVILIWLDGGPSHIDLYDMKPDAPQECRGPWKPIRTNVAGIEINEKLPRQAKVADKFSIIRSLHTNTPDHFRGAHYMITGRDHKDVFDDGTRRNLAGKYPSIGSIATKMRGARRPGIPPYVSIPFAKSILLSPGYFAGNYLGAQHNPFDVGGDPNADDFKVRHISLPETMSLDRVEDRWALLQNLNQFRRSAERGGSVDRMDRFQQQAYELITGSAAQNAFNIAAEDPHIRDSYGRHTWGQSTLLARRLVEAGATFVTVHLNGWDHHFDIVKKMETFLPQLDAAVAALFEDLDDRGLLDQVLVVVCGEMGRTPKMNRGNAKGLPGRDHWGGAMFCLLGGGGVQGGQILGATTSGGEEVKDRPVSPEDIHQTIYHVLGVDPRISFLDLAGRPTPVLDNGRVIHELL